ncbi:hypothetical protein I3F60_19685 [Streptomyces sp. MUM 136J]|uniref:hypothetical protein n=1 Tax=Streptomyces sp. MUM 136J TaxID=2791992 RepID=UPI001F0375B6|nr:hypothetical protein [Streptomyces sp. MUM 136J]MCH0571457.1 hypothetical protein [Streptomyces sp. MUM 136J]
MRRTARVLAVALLSGAAVAAVAPHAVAEPAAGPAAEVAPGAVRPGGTVTVSVSCDALGGAVPETLEATSPAFDEGTVQLRKVPAGGDRAAGEPAYRGTARISPAEDFEGADGTGPDTAWIVDGDCPAPPGGQDRPWSATFDVDRGPDHHGTPSSCPEPRDTSCGGPVIQHGVRAGEGGAFTGSVPALVAGGLFVAGAAGAAVHRLRRGHSDRRGRRV